MSNIGIALHFGDPRPGTALPAPAMFDAVRRAGFEYVQWRWTPGQDCEALRSALDAAGLKAIAGHAPLDDLEHADAISAWHALGAPDAAVDEDPAAPRPGDPAWEGYARRLRALAEAYEAAGLRLGYCPAPGRDAAAAHALAEFLLAEFDTAALVKAGCDPAEELRRSAGRAAILRLNPGAGDFDWGALFDAAEEADVEWYCRCVAPRAAEAFAAECAEAYQHLVESA